MCYVDEVGKGSRRIDGRHFIKGIAAQCHVADCRKKCHGKSTCSNGHLLPALKTPCVGCSPGYHVNAVRLHNAKAPWQGGTQYDRKISTMRARGAQPCLDVALDQVVWQQEVRDAFLDFIFVPAVPTHHLALHDLSLEQ